MVTEEEIAEKIRSNKLLFKYGKVKSSKLYFIALVNSSKVLDIGEKPTGKPVGEVTMDANLKKEY